MELWPLTFCDASQFNPFIPPGIRTSVNRISMSCSEPGGRFPTCRRAALICHITLWRRPQVPQKASWSPCLALLSWILRLAGDEVAVDFRLAGDEVARTFRLAGDEIARALRPGIRRPARGLGESRCGRQQPGGE